MAVVFAEGATMKELDDDLSIEHIVDTAVALLFACELGTILVWSSRPSFLRLL